MAESTKSIETVTTANSIGSVELGERIYTWTKLFHEIMKEFSEKYGAGVTPISISNFELPS